MHQELTHVLERVTALRRLPGRSRPGEVRLGAPARAANHGHHPDERRRGHHRAGPRRFTRTAPESPRESILVKFHFSNQFSMKSVSGDVLFWFDEIS